jgi:CHAT domain-containing protein/tetratricopeptide (TPR) repeat protein
MNRIDRVLNLPLYLLIMAGCLFSATGMSKSIPFKINWEQTFENNTQKNISGKESLDDLNALLIAHLQSGDLNYSKRDVEKIIRKVAGKGTFDNAAISASYYLVGVYFLVSKNFGEAIRYLKVSAGLKENRKEFDEQYAKTIYNIGAAYYGLGDFISQEQYSVNSLALEKKLYGESSPLLIKTYSSLAIVNIALQEYEKSLGFAKLALNIAVSNPGAADIADLASLYNNMGVLYMHLADYSKAKVYLEKSESIYRTNKFALDENYLNLLNSIAITYSFLGLSEKSDEYYERGIDLALSHNSTLAYNFINSYSIILAQRGNKIKGEALLKSALLRTEDESGKNSQLYFLVLNYYADFLSEFEIDNNKALEYFKLCVGYLSKNKSNLLLKDPLYIGYSASLADNGDYDRALEVLQSLLFPADSTKSGHEDLTGLYDNPSIKSVRADKMSLKILRLKYQILWKIYNKTQDLKILEAASLTAQLIVGDIEKVRINITEDDSRLILGDRYKDSYLNAIRDFNLLYRLTANNAYLEEAFEYSEKSKVAGLLTATRELNASQFNIPTELSELEKKLKLDINIRTARIDEEMNREQPDTFMINIWKENILKSSVMRDSLIMLFEKKYPGYYSFKYNTGVTKFIEIPGLIGRNGNYVNFIASDTVIYIFIANSKSLHLLALPADSSFYADIRRFRKLLGMPAPTGNAREAFIDFQETGYRLYKKIIEPVKPYLISKQLLISPDNILSYIPFETIPVSRSGDERILYNRIHYLMNDFDISYTYSATFMAESMVKESRQGNRLVAFAPNYSEPVDIGAILKNRQTVNGILPDLPYARLEAEYVSSITDGKLYENGKANETVYKNESGKYDIIHLAMHTILNDKDPMYSTLIFSPENDTVNDRFLKTYEIYSIPLRAKMVVLSSCNSGAGLLYSGEGIQSLARGFMYSGSESVVMAMWEIEDKAGTDIVKGFYDNLKKGYSKSSSLRRARMKYLRDADQLRSHPYFWSALVIYGNNRSLYYSKYIFIIPGFVVAVSALFLAFYFWRRKNS